MKIGIGLPASIPGVSGDSILDWARQADSGPFSSVGIIDRVVYPNWDPLITLAAVAAVAQRVRLMTTLLIAPVRDAALLAKQAASIDVLSGGRLTLGLGVGRREDDYQAVGEDFHRRGRRFGRQLALMKRVWTGEDATDGAGPIGPEPVQPGGPELLIGAFAPAAIKRAGRWADGYPWEAGETRRRPLGFTTPWQRPGKKTAAPELPVLWPPTPLPWAPARPPEAPNRPGTTTSSWVRMRRTKRPGGS